MGAGNMKKMRTINPDNIEVTKKAIGQADVIMYGAGGNGEKLLPVLQEKGLSIRFFCDDDFTKWGKIFKGVPVISFEQLSQIAKKERLNVILTSVFAGPIFEKLQNLDNVQVWEPFSFLIRNYYSDSFYNQAISDEELSIWEERMSQVLQIVEDEESKHILSVIKSVVEKQGAASYDAFFSVASGQDCYFISEVLISLPSYPVIVDCGGFTGDLMVSLERHGIDYKEVHSFEVNSQLFNVMCENIKARKIEDKFIPIHKGVWDKTGTAMFSFDPRDISGGNIRETLEHGESVEVIQLDDYCEDKKIDFVKMDIEGAELNALRGGIRTIRRDRPILAISLYHSVHDVVDIPLYLQSQLTGYCFYIRHHSFIGSETVLYAIPQNNDVRVGK